MRPPRSPKLCGRWRATRATLVALAVALGGCGFDDLDLDGGATVRELAIADDLTLAIDDHRALAVTLIYDDDYREPAPTDELRWTSADPAIASIDGDGQVRGRGRGMTQLTAAYRDRQATATLLVIDRAQALEIDASDRNCAVGEHLTYRARLRYQHGADDDVTARVTWAVDAPAIAGIDGGLITGRAVGDARVSATFASEGAAPLVATADVHVAPAVATAIAIAPTALTLRPGDLADLRATARFSDGNVLDATTAVRWESSLPAVATVGGDGVVRAVAPGQVTITAQRDGAAATAAVTVEAAP